MKTEEYTREALRTANPMYTHMNPFEYGRIGITLAMDMTQLLEGLMGLSGESGECLDILKKHLYQGHDLDKRHLIEELGDVLWYLTLAADALHVSLDEIMHQNINKLRTRYPENRGGFTFENSRERADVNYTETPKDNDHPLDRQRILNLDPNTGMWVEADDPLGK